MAYVSVAEWRPEQVTEWLKGLDNSIVSYIHWFSNNEVNGQQLLNLTSDELTHLGVYKVGHQELILEAVEHLRNFHYELDRENLQLLALKLSCAAHSLYSEIRDQAESSSVPTQIMADVANVIHNVKPLVSWLDRPPFAGQIQYADFKTQFLSLSLEMATSAQRDRFAERPVARIRTCSSKIAKLADSIIQDVTDPMILQPATLDLATIKKKVGEELDFFLVPSFHGIHQIGDVKLSSPAHQSGKIQQGDEIVQVNYQTVVGWSRKKVLALIEESPNDLLLTLKRRPRHVKMYGQIYMKPYRLPSRKRALPYSRWNDNLPSPRPELLTIPHFDISRTVNLPKKIENVQQLSLEPSGTSSSSSDEEFGQPSDSQSPASMRLYLPKPRASIQRRFTLSGPPRPSAQSEQFWRELQLERSWRSNQNNSQMNSSGAQNVGSKERNINEMFQLRDKSASLGNSIAVASRSTTCVPFSKVRIGSVKFDLTKFDSLKSESVANEKAVGEERDKEASDGGFKAAASEDNNSKAETSKEADSNKMPDSNGHGGLSRSELNKIKRDAFFNGMDCSNAHGESVNKSEQEGSSEKVRRVIENFKTEIIKTKKDMSEVDLLKSPGKVTELIENFERKELERSKPEAGQTEKLPKRERRHLDKSCSTPAYDTTEWDAAESDINDFRRESKMVSASSKTSSEKPFASTRKHEIASKFPPEGENSDRVKVGIAHEKNSSSEEENRKSKKLKEARAPVEKESDRESIADSGAESHSSDVPDKGKPLPSPRTSPEEVPPIIQKPRDCAIAQLATAVRSEEPNKPIPAQRKSKMPCKDNENGVKSNPCPLPPKPRSKPLPLSPEEMLFASSSGGRLPPEPPPRPESTISKPTLKKMDLIGPDRRDQEEEPPPRSGTVFFPQGLDSLASPGRNVVISAPLPTPPGTQGCSYEFKPLSAAGSPPGRKGAKSLGSPSSASGEKEKSKTGGSTLESLKAMLTLGRKSGGVNSPRSLRKKNAMLAKKRNVGVKEFTSFENSGFLWHRNRKGAATASWIRYYFILQGSNFYGFRSKESSKADLFVHLPGFTCTLAEEVKSKEFSFKIYHMGTVFYFAANSREDLQQWLDSVNLAISFQDDKFLPEAVTFSQTDSDSSDTDPEPETCFPTSPKMKKVLGSSPLPKPARSHQNLASDSKKTHDIQKRFGSLKKLSSQKPNTLFSGGNDSSEVASLDRKYLRFLGKNSPTPVPTSQFRSYRRMQPPPAIPPKGKPKVKSKNAETSPTSQNPPINNVDPSRLVRKPLHSSNPSLIHPDMADYRITQERLAEFRRLRNQNRPPNLSRFMTLDQFLQTRHEENFRSSRNRPPELSGLMTLEQFLLCQEEERQRSNRLRERHALASDGERGERAEEERHKPNAQSRVKAYGGVAHQSTSNPGVSGRQKKGGESSEKPQVAPRSRGFSPSTSGKLKNATMYQPPPAPRVPASASSQGEDSIVMAFEMTLDQNETRKPYASEGDAFKCDHGHNTSTPDYPGIEYPPAFEPETYTLQHMLKNRQKRDSEPKNK